MYCIYLFFNPPLESCQMEHNSWVQSGKVPSICISSAQKHFLSRFQKKQHNYNTCMSVNINRHTSKLKKAAMSPLCFFFIVSSMSGRMERCCFLSPLKVGPYSCLQLSLTNFVPSGNVPSTCTSSIRSPTPGSTWFTPKVISCKER